ncbi:Spy/CpxP family protein refolding chaperone [Leptolyngbya sp. FACHB-36]|uniref:Spy/CpxP family protein refolding chaperone n=1 Tax=Leptolyngbya sp. FACHB-36 TaxID=2692808 RepID=UPI0016803860|nr:Spy/CpxP family protein refolding chaperone [Leptolyngbya sp. FACHB-36]MBD2019893.1 Spy/CpxP family protein refolding chaperone [Leptolyngbya sp. FACHB-36]
MPRRRIAIIVAVFVALGGAVAAAKSFYSSPIAQMLPSESVQAPSQSVARTEPAPSPDKFDRGGDLLKNLNLTADQLQKVRVIRSQYRDPLAQQRQAMKQTQQELRSLMAGEASTEQVRQKYNQLKVARQQLADTQFDSMLAVREVLTLEQRRKFADSMQKRRQFKDRQSDRVSDRSGSTDF